MNQSRLNLQVRTERYHTVRTVWNFSIYNYEVSYNACMKISRNKYKFEAIAFQYNYYNMQEIVISTLPCSMQSQEGIRIGSMETSIGLHASHTSQSVCYDDSFVACYLLSWHWNSWYIDWLKITFILHSTLYIVLATNSHKLRKSGRW